MTRKEIERQKQVVRELRANGEMEMAKDLSNELSCRDMINSCLCYGNNFYRKVNLWDMNKQEYTFHSYADEYAEKLGMDRVNRLFAEQKIDFAKALVHKDVLTDDEGLSYNSIQWADEI